MSLRHFGARARVPPDRSLAGIAYTDTQGVAAAVLFANGQHGASGGSASLRRMFRLGSAKQCALYSNAAIHPTPYLSQFQYCSGTGGVGWCTTRGVDMLAPHPSIILMLRLPLVLVMTLLMLVRTTQHRTNNITFSNHNLHVGHTKLHRGRIRAPYQ